MKYLVIACIVISMPLISAVRISAGITPDEINRSFVAAVRNAQPSVVNILIYKRTINSGRTHLKKVAHGSGTVIMKEGYIVTNYHVVRKGNFYQVMHDNRVFDLHKMGGDYYLADPKTDLALMKIKSPGSRTFRSIEFGDSAEISPGELVLAIGNPYGLNQSITSGIVSYKGRDNIGFADIENFIQTDVPINPGNSGGPLVNLRGEMIGINTAIRTLSGGYQGISFAIPSNTVKKVASDLIKYGRVRRGWLGFLVKEKQSRKNVDVYRVEIVTVLKNSPAEQAGLQNGDIITSVNGKKVSRLGELISIVGSMDVGSRISFTIRRRGNSHNFSFLLREKSEYIHIQNILNDILYGYGFEIDENSENNQLIVTYVSPKSMTSGIRKGDLVISLNGKNVLNLDRFSRVYKASGKRIFSLELERGTRIIRVNFRN